MNFNRYANLVEATNDLPKRGYSSTFRCEDGKMVCIQTENKYASKDMKIEELHRFEGYSNPADNSIIYAVACNDGEKGIIVSSYGADADSGLGEFMKTVDVVPNEENVDFADRTQSLRKPR